jgi:hypothetical protein
MFELPKAWDPRRVAVNRDAKNRFLLRPGQILVAAGDEEHTAEVLSGWKRSERTKSGVTQFARTPENLKDPAKEVLAAIARVQKATAARKQGPARVAPNHVLVGEAPKPITMTGEPRVQGGPGASVRVAKRPPELPLRGARPEDGRGVRIAVLDTGLFDHPYLKSVTGAANAGDAWDVAKHDGYVDNESGHGTFIAGLILQVAPAAEVFVVKVLDSNGVGDDWGVAKAIEQLPGSIDIVNLSLGGYTHDDQGPLAISSALKLMRRRGGAVVGAAGNWGSPRPFWPAAFKQVLAVGAVREKGGSFQRADFSDHGWWVDACARGVSIKSTFAFEKTKVAQGPSPAPGDPTVTFDGWAAWDGTSFSTPIATGTVARTMTRTGLSSAADAVQELLATAPPAPQPDFPLAVLLDELA